MARPSHFGVALQNLPSGANTDSDREIRYDKGLLLGVLCLYGQRCHFFGVVVFVESPAMAECYFFWVAILSSKCGDTRVGQEVWKYQFPKITVCPDRVLRHFSLQKWCQRVWQLVRRCAPRVSSSLLQSLTSVCWPYCNTVTRAGQVVDLEGPIRSQLRSGASTVETSSRLIVGSGRV